MPLNHRRGGRSAWVSRSTGLSSVRGSLTCCGYCVASIAATSFYGEA